MVTHVVLSDRYNQFMNNLPDITLGVEQKLFAKAVNNRLPIYGNLELTALCNMNCDMCFVRLSPQEMKSRGRLRTVDEYIRLVDEMREAGVLFIQLTGGEPLLSGVTSSPLIRHVVSTSRFMALTRRPIVRYAITNRDSTEL